MNNAKRIRLIPLALAALSSLAAFAAQAGVADSAVHAKAAGIDLIVYPMGVKDVVTFTGSMPLGDAFLAAKADNPAVPTLTAMLLEAGTTRRDKFAISDTLDGIGAQLSFSPSAARIGIYGKSLNRTYRGQPIYGTILCYGWRNNRFQPLNKDLQAEMLDRLKELEVRV